MIIMIIHQNLEVKINNLNYKLLANFKPIKRNCLKQNLKKTLLLKKIIKVYQIIVI